MTALPKPRRETDSAYLEYVRSHDCLLLKYDGARCVGPVDAHHISKAGEGKVGSKPDDKRALPFCRFHHDHYHFLGSLDAFEGRYPIILEYQISLLNRAYKPKPKPKREKPCGIMRVTVRCRCAQGSHELAPSKVLMQDGGLSWNCPILKQRIEVA